jgi:3-methylcrotonyl-CoA carboxylase alpha subunit
MIRRLLIANRGEIAVRIARACRELGIESVAVYSDADRTAPHVVVADRAEHIGGSPASESYLNLTTVLDAAQRAGADAVHPGYGFLSERAAFADACRDRGLIFVGPPAAALAHMGSKIQARRLMQEAGVPVIPGETPDDQSDASLAAAVEAVGFPVLIKPSAGGGGIGMKAVRDPRETVEAIQRARREAQAAFGDAALYVERLVERPRHVEIQIFADSHGNIVHLFERECSIQRRHQKVIEESPCTVLTSSLRQQMGDAAVAAAKAVGYVNAGTVEFLLEHRGGAAHFYFVEMNARLQVEHPVTELVTGTDLVHAQLVVASGGRLPWTQQSLIQRGHAIECRIYAEDPSRDYLPQAGGLLMYREPQGPGIRVDAGVVEGSDVSVFYDPLLAKLVVHAETREAAIARVAAALRRYIVLGIHTNIPLLSAILRHPRFIAGDVDTAFLVGERDALQDALHTEIPPAALAAVALHDESAAPNISARRATTPSQSDPFETLRGWGLT